MEKTAYKPLFFFYYAFEAAAVLQQFLYRGLIRIH